MNIKIYDFFEKDKSSFRYDPRSIFMDVRNILIALLVSAMGIISYQFHCCPVNFQSNSI